MRQPAIKAQVIEDVLESLNWQGDGARHDLKIYSQPWGVDYTKIKARAVLWQGLSDTIVPVSAARALGQLLPDCRVIELSGQGHFWMYKASDEIVAMLRQVGPI